MDSPTLGRGDLTGARQTQCTLQRGGGRGVWNSISERGNDICKDSASGRNIPPQSSLFATSQHSTFYFFARGCVCRGRVAGGRCSSEHVARSSSQPPMSLSSYRASEPPVGLPDTRCILRVPGLWTRRPVPPTGSVLCVGCCFPPYRTTTVLFTHQKPTPTSPPPGSHLSITQPKYLPLLCPPHLSRVFAQPPPPGLWGELSLSGGEGGVGG